MRRRKAGGGSGSAWEPHRTTHPPSDAAVQGMGVVAAVAVLQAHVAAARVVEAACCRVAVLCREESNRQTAAETGAFEAVVVAMWAHPQVASVQRHSCRALSNGCIVSNAAGQARKQRAVAAGALEAVVAAMQAHWQDVGMLERGCAVLNNMVCHPFGSDATVQARKQRAGAAGALEAVVAAMRRIDRLWASSIWAARRWIAHATAQAPRRWLAGSARW